MKITVKNSLVNESADLAVLFSFEGSKGLSKTAKTADQALAGGLQKVIAEEAFTGKLGSAVLVRAAGGGLRAKKVLVLGLGKLPGRGEDDGEVCRRAAALAVKKAREARAGKVVVELPVLSAKTETPSAVRAFVEGAMLGNYSFTAYKGRGTSEEVERPLAELCVIIKTPVSPRLANAVERAKVEAQATAFVRDLVNEPASAVTPARLVAEAKKIAAAAPKRISLKIFDQAELQKMGLGGLLGVARGSDERPYLIHLTYRPAAKPKKRLALVGKGVTFDSGGLSLKPSEAMEDMKIDMSGAAVVLGVFKALKDLAPQVEVHGIAGVCENMPGGRAIKPGDVVKTMGGQTIEILNTDAEGRVTLADTLHYATTLKLDAIIDIATLTSACMVALGEEVAGLFANDDKLASRLLAAARQAGEPLWRLPLVPAYKPLLKSRVADYKNTAGRYGGAITAGLLLAEFVGKTSWAHLDIAGPAWAERDTVPYIPLGASGFGLRTILRYLESS